MNINNTSSTKENQSKLGSYPAMNRVLTVYNPEKFGQIRIITQYDEIGFVAKDIANILGYSDTNVMTRHLAANESVSAKLIGLNMPHTIIFAEGLYSAMHRSRFEGAKRLQRWITHEFIPAMRNPVFYRVDNILTNSNRIFTLLETNDERQRRKLAEQQRDEAIKAIKSKDRKIEYFKWQLYDPHNWVPIRNIPWLKDYFRMEEYVVCQRIALMLSDRSRRLGLKPRQVAHPELGAVNIYHKDVIQDFRDYLVDGWNCRRRSIK